ncbi:MAG TPA: LysR family transcriptional regulator [Euzebyales bacterium]|nr:LysR family transcriptional regulator [Euzebyales bacterium]
MDVHLQDLRYFVAAAEELHLTRAAERLGVPQPALSRRITVLENDLQITLFDRDRRSVTLTPAGDELFVAARGLLAAWDETRRSLADIAATTAAVLRIGLHATVGPDVLADLRERLRARCPGWRLEAVQVDWDDPACGLADHSTDLALMWLPLPAGGRYDHHVIEAAPRHVALHRSHPLAARDSVRFAELLDQPFIALPQEAGALRDFWLAVPQRNGRPATVVATARNLAECIELVAAGTGVALVTEAGAARHARPGLATVKVSDLPPAELALAWSASDTRDVVRSLVE